MSSSTCSTRQPSTVARPAWKPLEHVGVVGVGAVPEAQDARGVAHDDLPARRGARAARGSRGPFARPFQM